MISNRIRRAIQISVFAAGAALGAGTAQAAAYTGTWDPLFGQAISDLVSNSGLGWEGKATFEIPTSCLTTNGIVTNCAGMSLESAEVTLYKENLTTHARQNITIFNFSGASLLPFLDSVEFSEGDLIGVTGGFLLPKSVNLYDYFPELPSAENAHFWLSFAKGPQMFFVTCTQSDALTALKPNGDPIPFPTGSDHVTNWVNSNFKPQCGDVKASGWNDNGSGDGPGPLNWIGGRLMGPNDNKVPEPASLALVLSALGAGWMARRRRSL